MLELPESHVAAAQLNREISGKTISRAAANESPHGFAWYTGDPAEYAGKLAGRMIGQCRARAGIVEIEIEDYLLTLFDGVPPRYFPDAAKAPKKRQLYIEFADGSAMTCTVQMYGGMNLYAKGKVDNTYYRMACEKPSPLEDAFDMDYFLSLRDEGSAKLSAKAYLATLQRIPGLGNGVLQDILLSAGIHPKRKMAGISDEEYAGMFHAVKDVLADMAQLGGRDVERDIYGNPGGYVTKLSRNTVGKPCAKCGRTIEKAAYLGGAIYFCPGCQII